MSLAEVLPAVRALLRGEQAELMHWLVDEMARSESPTNDREAELIAQLASAAPFQLDRPEFGPEAVAVLQQLLAEHKQTS